MKILDLYINGFGKFHGQNLSFEDGLNIVYGKNEAGKSTIHTFIRGMLFGIEKQRGRSSKNDLYSRFEPWEDSETYEGSLRLSHKGRIYRIERTFRKNNREFKIVDETAGEEIEPTKEFLGDLRCGLSETAYHNTVSIGQLKSATDESMVTELRSYVSNLNTTGNRALNITKAAAFLKDRHRELESRMVPEAARTYTGLLGEIRNMEKEITSPEFENQMNAYKTMRSGAKEALEQKQKEKEELIQKAARGKQLLANSNFTNEESIATYLGKAQTTYLEYKRAKEACRRKSKKLWTVLSLIAATLLLCTAGTVYYLGAGNYVTAVHGTDPLVLIVLAVGAAVMFYLIGLILFLRLLQRQKELDLSAKVMQEIFSRHLGDNSISSEAMRAFRERISEFLRLNAAVVQSEASILQKAAEIAELQARQDSCGELIEKQQKSQWELDKILEQLSAKKTQAEGLKRVLAENDKIRDELAAIELALEIMTGLSTSIQDSFGLYLNKEASRLIQGITGGIYTSLSIDEGLNVFLNTSAKLIPLDQVSSGTMDQVYLALRLAAAKLIIGEDGEMPLIFDDSFALYDDDRLKTSLKWLIKHFSGQIIIFTCHQREAQMLTANQISYHLVEL